MLNLTSATVAVVFCGLALNAGRAHAQQSTQIAVTGGVATDQRGVKSNALTVAPSVSADLTRFALHLGASATRFATQAWSIGAGGSFGARQPLAGSFALTLNGSANASRLRAGS